MLRLAVDDRDALMLPRAALVPYHLWVMLSPWFFGLLVWHGSVLSSFGTLPSTLAAAFVAVGIVSLCPLYRSPLIRLAEGDLASLDVLEHINGYLTTGLFRFVLRPHSSGAQPPAPPLSRLIADHEQRSHLWQVGLASVTMVWLYGMGLTFLDTLLAAVPSLWLALWQLRHPLSALAAALLLGTIVAGMVLAALRLVVIPLQNLAAVAAVPLHRARRGIDSFYDKTVPASQAVFDFLADMPILAELSEDELKGLLPNLKFRAYRSGQNLVQQGDFGDAFFILAAGRAEVRRSQQHGPDETLDHLAAGDTFGEIALLEHRPRTATIKAIEPCRVLILERAVFDGLFPEGSEARVRLTILIRQVKLVMESQALSHLAPRQVRQLLRHSKQVVVAAGDFLIREHAEGDLAYLIAEGEAQVVHEHSPTEVVTLKRGDLVGATALLKGVKRTASVLAQTELTCLAIDKDTFLKMCLSNVFVATVVADLADRQLATNLKAG